MRVNNLSGELWTLIEAKKEDALEEHQRLMNNGWIQNEMKQLIKYICRVLQQEVNKFGTVYQVVRKG